MIDAQTEVSYSFVAYIIYNYFLHHCINAFQDGCTPLHLACIKRCLEVVNILLSAGAMPDIVENVKKISPLFLNDFYIF